MTNSTRCPLLQIIRGVEAFEKPLPFYEASINLIPREGLPICETPLT